MFQHPLLLKATVAAGNPAFSRSASTSDIGNNSVTLGFSGGASASGKVILLVAATNTGTSITVSGGSTWTAVQSGTTGRQCFSHVCGGSEPSTYTITYGGSSKDDAVAIVMIEISNASAVDASAATDNSATNPAVTTTAANDLVVVLAADSASGITYVTAPSGYATAIRAASVSANPDVTAALSYKSIAAIGSTSPGAWSSGTGKVFTVAVKA